MATKWIIGLIFLFVGLTIISGICEYQVFGDEETTILTVLMNTPMTETVGESGNIFAWLGWTGDFMRALFFALIFDYSFFQGQWAIVRILFFIPVAVGIIIALVFATRGSSST